MIEILINVIHISAALFMILVVLVQGGNSGGVGAAFGGGNSSGFFGASGATSFFGKLTYGAAGVFMMTSITLSVIQGKSGNLNLGEKLKGRVKTEAKEDPAKEGTSTTTPQDAAPAKDAGDKK